MYITLDTSVDVDIDDVLSEMSSREKEELCQDLIDEGYGPDQETPLGFILNCQTYTDRELVSLFELMWESRDFIDLELIENFRKQLREKNI